MKSSLIILLVALSFNSFALAPAGEVIPYDGAVEEQLNAEEEGSVLHVFGLDRDEKEVIAMSVQYKEMDLGQICNSAADARSSDYYYVIKANGTASLYATSETMRSLTECEVVLDNGEKSSLLAVVSAKKAIQKMLKRVAGKQ